MTKHKVDGRKGGLARLETLDHKVRSLSRVKDWVQLGARLVMAWGFYQPFLFKAFHFEAFVRWLAHRNFAAPSVSAFVTTLFQGLAVVLLPLGLCTRLLSFFLFGMVGVAMVSVHWQHGFNADDDGIEMCVYFCLILLSIVIHGPGRFSLDALLFNGTRKRDLVN